MGEARPWQIAVIVIGLVALVAGVVFQCSRANVPFSDTIILVDVTNGDLLEAPFPKNRPVMFPAKNPTTNTATLYPAQLREGKWYVEGRYIPYVPKDPKPTAMNAKSGEITTSSPQPVKKSVFEGT
ncbi:MAG: hypothetical protein U0637_07890 [Phycisphaerales bacterium]